MNRYMRQLYLFRHAEPESDYPQRFLGHTNPGLSPRGRKQAEKIKSSYSELVDVPVWTSPLLRALQTAEIAFPRASLRIEPLAMERHFGVLENLRPEAAVRLYPEAVERLSINPMSFVPNGGEGWSNLQERARKLATLLTDRIHVIISHQCFLLALASELTYRPLSNLQSPPLDYGQGWTLMRNAASDRWFLRDTS